MNRRSFFAVLAAIPAAAVGVFHMKRPKTQAVVASFAGGPEKRYEWKSYLGKVKVPAAPNIKAGDFVCWNPETQRVEKVPEGGHPNGICHQILS